MPLDAVGQRLQQAERADLVRAGPHRHPGHDPALEPDASRIMHDRKTKATTILMIDDPPRVVTEVGQGRVQDPPGQKRQRTAPVLAEARHRP